MIALAVALIILIVLCTAAAMHARSAAYQIGNTEKIASKLDGELYLVHNKHDGKQEAADKLAEMNARIVTLLRSMKTKYKNDTSMRGAITRQLLAHYNPDNIVENSPYDPEGDTAYTIDKGALIALCLRDGPDLKMIDDNTQFFVVLHELAHVGIKDLDHTLLFWRTFKFLLGEAHAAGLIVVVDYVSHPSNYCGIAVEYNPYLDPNLAPF